MTVGERRADRVGYVPQIDDVFGPLKYAETSGWASTCSRAGSSVPDRPCARDVPGAGTMCGHHAGKLSGNERKMLAISRALMPQPALVVQDEPIANLAQAIPYNVLNEHVRRLATEGASVLVVEQRARAVLEISDGTVRAGRGSAADAGNPAELGASLQFVDSF